MQVFKCNTLKRCNFRVCELSHRDALIGSVQELKRVTTLQADYHPLYFSRQNDKEMLLSKKLPSKMDQTVPQYTHWKVMNHWTFEKNAVEIVCQDIRLDFEM